MQEEGFRIVNCFRQGRNKTVPVEYAPANYVPAAAVIRREQALSGFFGCKVCVDGKLSELGNPSTELRY